MYRILFVFLCVPVLALAHSPALPEYASYDDITQVPDATVSRAYYAELVGFPHRYEFVVTEPQELFVEVLVPDTKEAENNIGAIIMKQKRPGLYDLVSELDARAVDWESFYEPFGGDSYRRGPSFTGAVEPGEYLIEVSTGHNVGKYIFVIGTKEDFSEVGFWGTMKRIYEVKRFLGKPPIAVLQSPFYLVPFLIVTVIGFLVYWRYKRHA